jgi:multiple sugar transport system substrate-binding protein
MDAAWIYLNEYISTGGQNYMWGITGRGSPARLSSWPSYLDSEFAPPSAPLIQQAMETIASHEIIDKPTGPQVTQTAGPIWDEVRAGNMSVEDGLNEVCASIQPLIAKNAE